MEQFFHNLLIEKFTDREIFYATVFFLLVVQEILVRIALGGVKSEYRKQTEKLTDPRELEEVSLQYYGKRQRIAVARIIGLSVIILAVAVYFDWQAGAVLALPVAAILIAFREPLVSFFTYFYVLSHFKIGDDIRINDIYGEVLSIAPTRTLIQTKDSDGEFTGRATEIPNYLFSTQPVSKQEAKLDTHRLVRLKIPLVEFPTDLSFETLISKLKEFLDELLPLRSARNVGHFRSLAGVRYKIDYEYHPEKGHLMIHLSFVSHPSHLVDRKEQIIAFIEAARLGKKLPVVTAKTKVDKKKKE
jgi:hypothetical protein